MSRGTRPYNPAAVSGSLSTGISQAVAGESLFLQPPANYYDDASVYEVHFQTNLLKHNIASDAALAFGQKLFTFDSGTIVIPIFTRVNFLLSPPTGLSATAGEVGLGTTVASGAVAVLSGTAGFEDFAKGKTIANLVAATPATETVLVNGTAHTGQTSADTTAIAAAAGEATAADLTLTQGLQVDYDKMVTDMTKTIAAMNPIIDCSSAAKSVYANIASTFNQTSAEDLSFSVGGVLVYRQIRV